MSLQIKSLTNTVPAKDVSLAAALDTFNIIPTANEVYDLYSAPYTSATKRGAIVKSIRLVNTRIGTSGVKVNLYFNRPNANGQNRRRLLTPPDVLLTDGFTYIDSTELTLEPGDKIQGKADVANVIQYVISGVERDEA
jgi:hypothetical protein